MDRTFFFVGKYVGDQAKDDGRTMGVRSRSEAGGVDAWMVPLMESDRYGDFAAAERAKEQFAEVMGDKGLEVYEATMTLKVSKVEVERPIELKRTAII